MACYYKVTFVPIYIYIYIPNYHMVITCTTQSCHYWRRCSFSAKDSSTVWTASLSHQKAANQAKREEENGTTDPQTGEVIFQNSNLIGENNYIKISDLSYFFFCFHMLLVIGQTFQGKDYSFYAQYLTFCRLKQFTFSKEPYTAAKLNVPFNQMFVNSNRNQSAFK